MSKNHTSHVENFTGNVERENTKYKHNREQINALSRFFAF